jgi:hypothetical protein
MRPCLPQPESQQPSLLLQPQPQALLVEMVVLPQLLQLLSQQHLLRCKRAFNRARQPCFSQQVSQQAPQPPP